MFFFIFRLEKRVLLSESSKTGSFFRRSLLNVSEVDEMKNGTGDMKGRLHSPEENERVQGYVYEVGKGVSWYKNNYLLRNSYLLFR